MGLTAKEILQGIDGAKTSYDYGNTRMPEGFELYRGSDGRIKTYNDPDTGFQATLLYNPDTNHLMFSATGTQDLTDWHGNANLGVDAWIANRSNVLDDFQKAVDDKFHNTQPLKISAVGHSLGGAEAQYFSAEIVQFLNQNSKFQDLKVNLITVNSLGGSDGVNEIENRFYKGSAGIIKENQFKSDLIDDRIVAYHLRLEDDRVSYLGNGHIGGPVYVLPRREDLPEGETEVNFTHAHVFDGEHGVFSTINKVGLENAYQETPQYYELQGSQQLAGAFSVLGNDGQTTNLEGGFRLISGILQSVATSDPNSLQEVDRFIADVASNFSNSGKPEVGEILGSVSTTKVNEINNIVRTLK